MNRIVTGSIIWRRPLIVLAGLNGSREVPISFLSYDKFLDNPDPIYFFLNPMWSMSDARYRATLIGEIQKVVERFPQHVYTFLVNDPWDLPLCAELPSVVKVFVCGEHAVVDVNRFVFSETPRQFDAVYVARVEAYKRIELAADVPRVCLLSKGVTLEQISQVRKSIPQLECPNISGGSPRLFDSSEVAALLNASGCGLILSQTEGQNRSTIEYLLCGLPVVTTPNRGGRDRWLHPGNSVYADDNRSAIASAVAFVNGNNFDRSEIAKATRSAVSREREWLRDIINSRLGSFGIKALSANQFSVPHHGFSCNDYIGSHMHSIGRSFN